MEAETNQGESMNIYIWNCIEYVSNNYHNGGGCVVVAASLEEARTLLPKSSEGPCEALTKEPDAVYPLANAEERCMFVFPDAGCC